MEILCSLIIKQIALQTCMFQLSEVTPILPLDVDSVNENDSVANPDPTPRIASVHKSRFAEVVLVGCWMEAVYYCLLLHSLDVFY